MWSDDTIARRATKPAGLTVLKRPSFRYIGAAESQGRLPNFAFGCSMKDNTLKYFQIFFRLFRTFICMNIVRPDPRKSEPALTGPGRHKAKFNLGISGG
jgi:hypothetical protein